MVQPERRTRTDLLVAAAIVVAVVVAAASIWLTSDARATVSRPAAVPVPALTTARDVPGTLRELWRASSAKTSRPIVAGGSVVTGDGGRVDGRDSATGNVLWSYARDRELCGVTYVYQLAVAVYPDDRGCGQVSTIDGRTGRRDAARSSYADRQVQLSSDGTAVLSYGDTRLEQWRSDMVRMLSWGYLDARLKPDVPKQPICRLTSAAASVSAVSIIESCPGRSEPRLTLLRADKEEDQPLVKYVPLTGVPDDGTARVIAVSGTTTAIYRPRPQATVDVIDDTGTVLASTLVPKPPSPDATATAAGDVVTWWTGDGVMVFTATGLRYRYSVSAVGPQAPVGPATVMAGKLLVPVTTGYDVFEPATGAGQRHLPLDRPAESSPVIPAVAGNSILEQRGDTLVALG